ncbi:MAG: MOSC domain-containing protein [Pseudomonadota bacterium]
MAILAPTAITGQVRYLGVNPSREGSHVTQSVAEVEVTFSGFAGESHSGLTRLSCGRVVGQYPKGTEIRNTRQVSILSQEDLDLIAAGLGIEELPASWVGASIILEGIPDFTLVPPSSRLTFEGGVSLVVDMENAPCSIIAKEIERHHKSVGKSFKSVATHHRGVTAWVEREGKLRVGETVRLHVPPQRLYPPLSAQTPTVGVE